MLAQHRQTTLHIVYICVYISLRCCASPAQSFIIRRRDERMASCHVDSGSPQVRFGRMKKTTKIIADCLCFFSVRFCILHSGALLCVCILVLIAQFVRVCVCHVNNGVVCAGSLARSLIVCKRVCNSNVRYTIYLYRIYAKT